MLKSFKPIVLSLALAGPFASPARATSAEFDFSVIPVAENVYSIIAPSYGRPTAENRGWNSNSHFVVTTEGVLVFDTGSSEVIGKEIIKAVRSVTQEPVRWVVNSHSHADHWLGNAAFADAGAEILSTALSVSTMKQDGAADVKAFSRMTQGATGDTRLSYPTTLVSEKHTRRFGDVEAEFIFTHNGHSPGDVMMWLPQQKIIFGGDVVSADWLPIMTPRGNVPELIATLKTLEKLAPNIVLTGHGETTTVKSVMRDIDFLQAVWQRVKAGHNKGIQADVILSQVNQELGPRYKTLYQDFDANGAYLVEMMYEKQQ